MTVAKNRVVSLAVMILFFSLNVASKIPKIEKPAPFDHNRKEHKGECNSCHLRKDNSPAPRFPSHQACINCHVSDFISPTSQLCSTCHVTPLNDQGDTRRFAARSSQFGLKEFSHATHADPKKMPKDVPLPACLSCHKFNNAALKTSFPSHPECYGCHEHQAGQKKGTCDSCHSFVVSALRYSHAPGDATNKFKFTHENHFKAQSVQKVCSRCHKVIQNAAATQVDVSQIRTIRVGNKPHQTDCYQSGCHNTQRELNCLKCHITPPVKIGD